MKNLQNPKIPKSKIQKSKNPKTWEIVRRTLDFGIFVFLYFCIFVFLDWKSTFKRTNICKNIVKLCKKVQKVQKVQKRAKRCKKCKKVQKVQKVQKARKSTKSITKHKKHKIQKSKTQSFLGDCPGNLDFCVFGLLFHFAVGPLGGGGGGGG